MKQQVVCQFNLFFLMKFLIISVIVFFSLMVGFFNVTQGALPRDHSSLEEVSLQYQIRDSEGMLIVYYEPTLMYITNINLVHEYLDTKENTTKIFKEGKYFELFEWKESGRFSHTNQYSSYNMWYKGTSVLALRHDGYLSQPGDTYLVSWKVIRPLQ